MHRLVLNYLPESRIKFGTKVPKIKHKVNFRDFWGKNPPRLLLNISYKQMYFRGYIIEKIKFFTWYSRNGFLTLHHQTILIQPKL
jgi:hypothetical protein